MTTIVTLKPTIFDYFGMRLKDLTSDADHLALKGVKNCQ